MHLSASATGSQPGRPAAAWKFASAGVTTVASLAPPEKVCATRSQRSMWDGPRQASPARAAASDRSRGDTQLPAAKSGISSGPNPSGRFPGSSGCVPSLCRNSRFRLRRTGPLSGRRRWRSPRRCRRFSPDTPAPRAPGSSRTRPLRRPPSPSRYKPRSVAPSRLPSRAAPSPGAPGGRRSAPGTSSRRSSGNGSRWSHSSPRPCSTVRRSRRRRAAYRRIGSSHHCRLGTGHGCHPLTKSCLEHRRFVALRVVIRPRSRRSGYPPPPVRNAIIAI